MITKILSFVGVKNILFVLLIVSISIYSYTLKNEILSSKEKIKELNSTIENLNNKYDSLMEKYVISEESNKKINEINSENVETCSRTIEAMKIQIEEERESKESIIKKYKDKISILQGAKNVKPSETTGVMDQNTSKKLTVRMNSVIEDFNRRGK